MSEDPPSTSARPDPEKRARTYDGHVAASVVTVGLAVAVVLPAMLTLSTVRREIAREAVLKLHALENPTPYGYTVSLLLYLIPIAALTTWFYRTHAPGSFRRVALRRTLLLLVPIGFGLDFFLGNLFFMFPNTGAVLGIYLPGFSFETGGLLWDLPIEEFIFYASGFYAMLLLYIWCNEVWVPAYGISEYRHSPNHPPYVVRIHWPSLGIGVVLFVITVVYKKFIAPEDHRNGFPLYMTFLLLAAVIPGLLLHRCACPFTNWRAFSVTLLWVLLTSMLWEATLASPFGWWRYRAEWMMGLHVVAWADLPFEAVVLWIAVSYTAVTVYETMKVFLHIEKPTLKALFGDAQSG